MTFAQIATRTYGLVDPSWWNTLKAAGERLELYFGGGFIPETSVALANNQVAAANVTGLVLDKTLYKSGRVTAEIRRKTATNEAVAVGTISMIYRTNTNAWEVVDVWDGDAHGVTLSITSAGQVQYTTDNMTGTGYSGTIKFKLISFSV